MNRSRRALMVAAAFFSAALFLPALTGCAKKSEPPAGASPPKTEQPAAPQPKSEHPEHPQ